MPLAHPTAKDPRQGGQEMGATMAKLNRFVLLPMVALALLGCQKKELILQGQRFDVRTPLEQAIPTADGISPSDIPVNRVEKIRLGQARNLANWTHLNGGPTHSAGNLAFSTAPALIWSSSIGDGNDRKHRITSSPIIAGGLIYTLDAQSRVMAHSLAGEPVWSRDLVPPSDQKEDATGGGLAFANGTLYATTGFGALTAMQASDSSVIWQQKLDSAVTSAPTVYKNHVYVVGRDNRAWALNTKNGRVDWQQQSTFADAGLIGGASPAIAGRTVVLPFSSGELVAALPANGLRVWSIAVSGSRLGHALSNIGDISSDPVVSGARVYAANQSGRIVAANKSTGDRLWTATQGSYGPVLPAGNSVFLVSDKSQLVRLDAHDGSVIWAVDLPKYVKAKDRKDSYAHFGPVLAAGRLWVASSDGQMRSFDPTSGAELSRVAVPSGAASPPAIVGGVMYLLAQNGQLLAYR